MVPAFLAHGEMARVRKVIVEMRLLKTNGLGECDGLYDAMTLSLEEDRHKRVVGLFEAAHGRPSGKHKFDLFTWIFFERHAPEKDSMPLKRFLTLHKEEFSKKHPVIFEAICQDLVSKLQWQSDNLDAQRLLIGLVGQHSLLTPIAFAKGFLYFALDSAGKVNFIKYGYKEALEEGLKGEYPGGGRKLWVVMVYMYPNQFSGEYTSTDEALMTVLKNLKTKQDREEEWALANASSFSPKLVARLQEPGMLILLPLVLWDIVVGYAATGATWVDV